MTRLDRIVLNIVLILALSWIASTALAQTLTTGPLGITYIDGKKIDIYTPEGQKLMNEYLAALPAPAPVCVDNPYPGIITNFCSGGNTPTIDAQIEYQTKPTVEQIDTPSAPLPGSRTLMFGNAFAGQPGQAQDYVAFLNLANGWKEQVFLVTIVAGNYSRQYVYPMKAWSHQSVVLNNLPGPLLGQTTGFAVFVQAWGLATATMSLHKASDPWGPAILQVQPDAIPTPLQQE